jgi:hypothetical protein
MVNVMSAIYCTRVDRLFPFVSSLRRSRQRDIGTHIPRDPQPTNCESRFANRPTVATCDSLLTIGVAHLLRVRVARCAAIGGASCAALGRCPLALVSIAILIGGELAEERKTSKSFFRSSRHYFPGRP